jgi:hypothetical protein
MPSCPVAASANRRDGFDDAALGRHRFWGYSSKECFREAGPQGPVVGLVVGQGQPAAIKAVERDDRGEREPLVAVEGLSRAEAANWIR